MKTTLGTLISEYSVRNKSNKNIPVYSVTNERGFCTGYFSKEVASNDKTTYKIVPRGFFAYNPSRINVGSVDWLRCEESVIVNANQGLKTSVPKAAAMRPKICRSRPVRERTVEAV